jgi:hypothetical protein
MGDKLVGFGILSAEFSQSIANDQPKQYSLKKLIEAASNDSKAYNGRSFRVYDESYNFWKCTWLTYFNIPIIILILICTIPCHRFTGVATADILPAQAHGPYCTELCLD